MNQASNKILTISEFLQGIQSIAEDIKMGITALKENLEVFASTIQKAVPFLLTLQQELPRFAVMQFSEGLITDHRFVSMKKRKTQGWDFGNWKELIIAISDENIACVITPSTFTFVKYSDLGFCDKRNGKVNKEWVLFEDIAQAKDIFNQSPNKKLHIRQQKYQLDKKLQSFFGITKSAFESDSYFVPYKARFSLKYINQLRRLEDKLC